MQILFSATEVHFLKLWLLFIFASLLCRYSVRNALGLELLGVPGVPSFFDNTKLFVFGLIAHTLQSNGFVDLLS